MKIINNKYGMFIEPDYKVINENNLNVITEELSVKQYSLCQRITISLVGGLFGALLLGNLVMYIRYLCCNFWVKYHGYEIVNVVVG